MLFPAHTLSGSLAWRPDKFSTRFACRTHGTKFSATEQCLRSTSNDDVAVCLWLPRSHANLTCTLGRTCAIRCMCTCSVSSDTSSPSENLTSRSPRLMTLKSCTPARMPAQRQRRRAEGAGSAAAPTLRKCNRHGAPTVRRLPAELLAVRAAGSSPRRSPPAIPFSLGSRRYSEVWPPSKPGRVPLPERDFWPRMPKPQLPPCKK